MNALTLTPKKFIVATASSLALIALLLVGPLASAAVPPSIEGGNIYRVRNVTKNTSFTDPASADKCDTLQYRVRIHNPGPDTPLTNVTVQATIPSAASTQNVSTVIIRASNAVPTSTSDTATVNLSSAQKVSYVPGSSQLLNSSGGVISSIGDVTAGSGVNIGSVGVSINEQRYVQFQAKVDCPSTPPCVDNPNTPNDECNPKPPCVDNPNTPMDECNPVTPPTTPPTTTTTYEETPTGSKGVSELLETGPNSIVAVAAILASIAGYFGYRRHLSNQLQD